VPAPSPSAGAHTRAEPEHGEGLGVGVDLGRLLARVADASVARDAAGLAVESGEANLSFALELDEPRSGERGRVAGAAPGERELASHQVGRELKAG
jgi:hypothetical protein